MWHGEAQVAADLSVLTVPIAVSGHDWGMRVGTVGCYPPCQLAPVLLPIIYTSRQQARTVHVKPAALLHPSHPTQIHNSNLNLSQEAATSGAPLAPDGSVALSSSLASATQSAPLPSASAPGLSGGAGAAPGAGAGPGLGAGPTAAGSGGYAAVGSAAAVGGGAAAAGAGTGPLVQLQLQRTSSSSPSELALLGGAVSQTYERSGELPTEAVLSLLSALGEVSLRSLPTQVRNRGLLQQGICCNRGLQHGFAAT